MTYTPDCDRPIPSSVLRDGAAVWLLSVTVAGRVLRWSTRPVSVGGHRWRGGMPSVRVEQVMDFLQQDAAAPSVSVGLVLSEEVARWVSYGHRLTGEAELSLWVEGTDYNARQVIVRGPLLSGSYGAAGEPITATIEPQPQGEGGPVGDASQSYGGDSIAEASFYEQSDGEEYPLVVGQPFVSRRKTGASWVAFAPYATKAVVWARDTSFPERVRQILICRGHVPDGDAVRIAWEDTADPADEGFKLITNGAVIVRDYDLAGRAITYVDVAAEGLSIKEREAKTWWIRWDRCSGGTVKNPGGVETVTRAYTGSDTPLDETLAVTRGGDVVIRAQAVVSTAFDTTPTLKLDLKRATVDVPLLNLSGGDLTTTGTRTGLSNIGSYTTSPIRLQATGGAGAALVRLEIRRAPRPGDSIRTLGELMLWLVERSNQRTDYAAWASMLPFLDVPIGGRLDPAAPAWETLLKDVLPLAPVSLRTGPAGIVPVLWRWWATAGEAEAQLRVGYDGIVRLPDIRAARPDGEISTSARVQYAFNARSNRFSGTAFLRGDDFDPKRSIARRSLLSTLDATVSRQTYGPRVLQLESRLIYSTATAMWWARWRLAAEGWAHRIVQIEGRASLASLMPGAVVTLTDTSVYLDNAVALVLGRTLTDVGRAGLTLALVDGASSIRTTTGATADTGPPIRPGGSDPTPN